jgi:hypothetical protein
MGNVEESGIWGEGVFFLPKQFVGVVSRRADLVAVLFVALFVKISA